MRTVALLFIPLLVDDVLATIDKRAVRTAPPLRRLRRARAHHLHCNARVSHARRINTQHTE